MRLDSCTVILFSPTGTTKKILQGILSGLEIPVDRQIDLTRPESRENADINITSDLLLIGVPVYEERIPRLLSKTLGKLKGSGQPAILVALYGNVHYGLALKQLEDLTTAKGFLVAAAGAFIGEHSFTHHALPIAPGRPDEQDLRVAKKFGRDIREKLDQIESPDNFPTLDLPGKMPFFVRLLPKSFPRWFTRTPVFDTTVCTNCGVCAKACPTGALAPDTLDINEKACRRCFACVKMCPAGAREIRLKKGLIVRKFFSKALSHPRVPSLFL